MEKPDLSKLLSARFILSVGLGLTFCYGFIVKIVSPELFMPVVLIVIKDYFERKDRDEKPNS